MQDDRRVAERRRVRKPELFTARSETFRIPDPLSRSKVRLEFAFGLEAKKMSDNEKSTDPGLSAAKRKELRGHEAREAIADREEAQKAFHENRKRLREERLTREAAAGPMLYPAQELPDDTPIDNVRFVSRIRNALNAAGM